MKRLLVFLLASFLLSSALAAASSHYTTTMQAPLLIDGGSHPDSLLDVWTDAPGELGVVRLIIPYGNNGGRGYIWETRDASGGFVIVGNIECIKDGKWDTASRRYVNCLWRVNERGTQVTYLSLNSNLGRIIAERPLYVNRGSIRVQEPGEGMYLTSPDGLCTYALRVSNQGVLELLPAVEGCP